MRALLLVLLFAAPAWAQEPAVPGGEAAEPAAEAAEPAPKATPAVTAASVAQEADAVVTEHCSDAAVADGTQAARAVATVSSVLARVSEVHDATGEPWLLYWRGVLQACIDREERAIEDLQAFLATPDPGDVNKAQREDAERRLRRLGVRVEDPSAAAAPPVGAIVGGGLLGAGGVLGGLGAWQGARTADLTAEFAAGKRPWAETELLGFEAEETGNRATGLSAAAVGLGVGGVAAFVITAVTSKTGAPVAAVVVPTSSGVALSIGGRW